MSRGQAPEDRVDSPRSGRLNKAPGEASAATSGQTRGDADEERRTKHKAGDLFSEADPARAVLDAATFAEVAVPLFVRQTYSYRLIGSLAEIARPGCRVLVPFGKKLVTGYVVALHDQLDEALDPASLKDVEQVLDEEPILTEEILTLTRWVADYYYAPWGECLRSALPAGLAASSEAFVTITDAGRLAIATVDERRRENAIFKALARIVDVGTLRARDLQTEMPAGARQRRRSRARPPRPRDRRPARRRGARPAETAERRPPRSRSGTGRTDERGSGANPRRARTGRRRDVARIAPRIGRYVSPSVVKTLENMAASKCSSAKSAAIPWRRSRCPRRSCLRPHPRRPRRSNGSRPPLHLPTTQRFCSTASRGAERPRSTFARCAPRSKRAARRSCSSPRSI